MATTLTATQLTATQRIVLSIEEAMNAAILRGDTRHAAALYETLKAACTAR